MNQTLPTSATYVVIGAGVHGLSTAWHLAKELIASGKGSGKDIVIIDKTGPGAGASGIACGCVRNFYMTEPLHAILRHSVDVWESDPVTLGFQQVGYISCGEANQTSDYEKIHASQNAVDYASDLYVGKDAEKFLTSIWPDFKIGNIDVALHEKPSGYAGTTQSMWGMDEHCRRLGVQRCYGVEATGYDMTNGRISSVLTDKGNISADCVIICTGAWLPKHWEWLGKSDTLDVRYPDGHVEKGMDMWTFWRLLEGEVYLDEPYRTVDDRDPPILHVELMNTTVVDENGREFDEYFYTYVRYAAERMGQPGLQGGTIPIKIGPKATLDPYGHDNDEYQADDWFADYYCATLAMLMTRFEGLRKNFITRRNGGIGAFTPDNVPIFDWVADNAYMIADSNHGFKMTGVGKLVAKQLISGNSVAELEPFAFSRFTQGTTFGDRNSNCPWV